MSRDIGGAITATIQVVDWEGLGEVLAAQNSDDQAYALLGFWSAMHDEQVPFIGDSRVFGDKGDPTRTEMAEFYRCLAEWIENGSPR